MSSCQRALALQPDHPQLLTTLGALYQAQGLLGEAVAAYKRAHQLRPEDQVGGFMQGRASARSGTLLWYAGCSVHGQRKQGNIRSGVGRSVTNSASAGVQTLRLHHC